MTQWAHGARSPLMRTTASILHLDLDSFFASVEQRDKPSLRGKPVVVGGTGGRGVVATASYEARAFGVRSAMSTREARALCPNAAFLSGRFDAYRAASRVVMGVLGELSDRVEPLSLDEAYVDLSSPGSVDVSDLEALRTLGEDLRGRIRLATGGLVASVGIASSKFLAKIASELDKPDGLTVIAPGTELDVLRPMDVRSIPGVGPATAERLRRIGVQTVAQLQEISEEELVRVLGRSHGHGLHELAFARDDRAVEPDREVKSVSVEGTYEVDLTGQSLLEGLLTKQAGDVATRLRASGLSGRTISIKVRLHDFTTLSRSTTLPSPTDARAVIARAARGLLGEVDVSGGVRLLGVGVSGLADWIQEELFTDEAAEPDHEEFPEPPEPARHSTWPPGADVHHDQWGAGWVWGSGRGVVTVRFETADTAPGPVRSFSVDDPALRQADPIP